jgi:hypothetical protein
MGKEWYSDRNRPGTPLFVIIRLDRMIQKCPAGPIKELDRPVKPDDDKGTGQLLPIK